MTVGPYKGYTGTAMPDDDWVQFEGLLDIARDVITFQGRAGEELEQAFRDSVDDYLERCVKLEESPEPPRREYNLERAAELRFNLQAFKDGELKRATEVRLAIQALRDAGMSEDKLVQEIASRMADQYPRDPPRPV